MVFSRKSFLSAYGCHIMKRIRVTEFIPAPCEAVAGNRVDAIPEHLLPSIYASEAGHPNLLSFIPGAAPRDESQRNLLLRLEQKARDGTVTVSAVEQSTGERWNSCCATSSDYLIAIVNRKEGSAKVLEVAREYRLTRKVISAVPTGADGEKSADDRTHMEQRIDLLETFGGKRAQDRQAKIRRNAITDERVTSEVANQLNFAVEEHQQKDAAAGVNDSTTSVLAPPHNASASRVEDAYPLVGLMPAVVFSFIRSVATSFIDLVRDPHDDPKMSNPGWHDLVWDLMIQATEAGKNCEVGSDGFEEMSHRVIAAIYLHYLLVLSGAGDNIGLKDYQALKDSMAVPDNVFDRLLAQFTEHISNNRNHMRFRSERLKTQLLYIAVVLWLTANGFSVAANFEELASSLRISMAKLLIHIAHVGGKVKRIRAGTNTSDEFAYRAFLTVPLTFPPIRRRAKGPKRR